jgi:hypothetical protein
LLKGLPSHGQLLPIITQNIPPMKNISTAIDEFQKNITSAMAKGLGSKSSNVGNVAKNILSNAKQRKQIADVMDPELFVAFESIVTLMPSYEGSDDGEGYIMGGRVNEPVFANNAVKVFKTCTSVTELVYAFQELHSNTAHHGLDELANVTAIGETAWGNTDIILTPSGDFIEIVSANTANIANTYKNEMKSSSSAPSGAAGQNMFSDSAGTMMDMLKRLSPSAQKDAKKLMDKVNKSAARRKADEAQKRIVNGQRPLEAPNTKDTNSGNEGPTAPNINEKSDEWDGVDRS